MFDLNYMKDVFGQADEDTKNRIRRTLEQLSAAENESGRRTAGLRFKITAAVIAACFLVSGTVFAMRGGGLLDFFSSNGFLPPKLPEIIQRNVQQNCIQADVATITVREAVFDGTDIIINLAITPADENTRLYHEFQSRLTTLSDAPFWKEWADGKNIVIAGIDNFVPFSRSCGFSSELESDGTTLRVIIASNYSGPEADSLDLEIPCTFTPFNANNNELDLDGQQFATLSFTLQNTGHFAVSSNTQPVEFTEIGVRIDNITLSASELSVAARVEYTVIDQEKFDALPQGDLLFEFLKDGYEGLSEGKEQWLSEGPGGASGQTFQPDAANKRFYQESSLQAMETLPDYLIIRAYSYLDGTRYETHTVELRKAE